MTALIIILVLLLALMLLKVGVDLSYAGGTLRFMLKIGLIRLQILPKKEAAPKKEKEKKSPPTKKKDAETPKKKQKRPLGDYLEILKLVFDTLGRFRRALIVDVFHLYFAAASDDPYRTAMTCAYANAAYGILAPPAERAFRVRDRHVVITTDFVSEKPVFSGELVFSIRVWRALYTAAVFGIGFLRLRRKNGKNSDNNGSHADQNDSSSAKTEEKCGDTPAMQEEPLTGKKGS